MVETILDPLNASWAFFAIQELFDERKIQLPLMASLTFIQANSKHGFVGQTVEAFWTSISRALVQRGDELRAWA